MFALCARLWRCPVWAAATCQERKHAPLLIGKSLQPAHPSLLGRPAACLDCDVPVRGLDDATKMMAALHEADFSIDSSGGAYDPAPTYFVDAGRPSSAKPTFQRKKAGGGGGAGAGRGGLGGRHANKTKEDVLPRAMNSISGQASRHVANKPQKITPPASGAFKEKKPTATNFRVMYERGDLPLRVNGGVHRFVCWHVGEIPSTGSKSPPSNHREGSPEYLEAKQRFLTQLDYTVWLPLFFEGLREQSDPCRFLAVTAVKDLLAAGTYEKVAPVVPLLILPLRIALNTREPATIRRAITALQQLIAVPSDPQTGQSVGEAMAPFFRHLLPIFNLFKSNKAFASGHDDYHTSLGEIMDETLHLFSAHGGPGAAREINRIVPLWTPPPPVTKNAAGGFQMAAGSKK